MPTPPIPTPTETQKLVIDSKFRRETSNFKIDFDLSSIGTGSDPVLIKYIEKNLKPEELLGAVVTFVNKTTLIAVVTETLGDGPDDEDVTVYILKLNASNVEDLFYVPSTGALSLFGAYVEEEEGGDDGPGEAIIVNPGHGGSTEA